MSGTTDDLRVVRDVEVVCSGEAERPHLPRLIELPPGEIVLCPACNRPYRRAAEWNNLTRAIWPKRE